MSAQHADTPESLPVELSVEAHDTPSPPARGNAPLHGERGSRLRSWLTAGGLLLAGLIVGGVGGRVLFPPSKPADTTATDDSSSDPAGNGTVVFDTEAQRSVGMDVVPVVEEPLTAFTWRPGRVALHEDRLAHICPPAEGVVREVTVRLGQTVAEGDKLAVIECKELGQAKLDAHRAKLAVTAEREAYTRTRTTMANAEELLKLLGTEAPVVDIEKAMAGKPIGDWRQQLIGAYTRRNQLQEQVASLQASPGVVPGATLRKMETEADAAAATYTSLVEECRFQAKQQVRQAELKLKEAETALDVARTKLLLFGLTPAQVEAIDPIAEGVTAAHLVIAAPFAGTVVEKHAVRSERVDPKDQLFLLADLSRVWIQADAYEADLPVVRGLKNRAVKFRSVVGGIGERPATVVHTGDVIDHASRSFMLTAETDNSDRMLKPGLFVEVGFDTGNRSNAIQVPAGAILRDENRPFVFVQTAPNQFRRVEVELGRTGDDMVEVTAGLKPGDQVVVRGGFVLKSELLKDQMAGE